MALNSDSYIIVGQILKYSEDQQRDDHGRFGSGSEEKSWEPSEKIKEHIEMYTIDSQMSYTLVDAIKEGPQTAPSLFRGINIETEEERQQVISDLQKEKVVEFPPTSWSSNREIGELFSTVDAPSGGYGKYGVIFELDAGAKGINFEPYATEDFAYQKEWGVAGKFEVKSVSESTNPADESRIIKPIVVTLGIAS